MKRWESKANSSLYSSETEKNKIMSTLVQTHTKTASAFSFQHLR